MYSDNQVLAILIATLVGVAVASSGLTGVVVYKVMQRAPVTANGNGIRLKMSLVQRLFAALVLTLLLSFVADILNATGMFPNQMNSSYITQAFTFLLGTFTGLIVPEDFKIKAPIDKTGKEIV